MQGKSVFITGAATGIGRASAILFAKAGARVMAIDIKEGELEETGRLVRESGGEIITKIVDVRNAKAVEEAVAMAVNRFGRLDCAHNNAGVIAPATPFDETSVDIFKEIMDTNFYGVLYAMQAEIKHMLKLGGGSIVNTASINSLLALDGIAPYVSSKHAVLGLTRTVAHEYAPKNIRINALCPGFVDTPLTEEFMRDPVARKHILSLHPLGRAARPEEIAEAALWLCSERSSYIVGLPLVMDAGYSLI